jgi:hypothetical protein
MGGVNKTSKLEGGRRGRKDRQGRRKVGDLIGNMGEAVVGNGATVLDTPGDSIAEVLGNTLESEIVDASGAFREFCKGSDGIANVRAGSHIGVKNFTKELSIGEANVGLKSFKVGSMFGRALSGIEGRNI